MREIPARDEEFDDWHQIVVNLRQSKRTVADSPDHGALRLWIWGGRESTFLGRAAPEVGREGGPGAALSAC